MRPTGVTACDFAARRKGRATKPAALAGVGPVVVLCLALVACGGGGGGSGGSAAPVGTPDPVVNPPQTPLPAPTSQETSANRGIAQIRADVAYAAGAAGRGVKVAVIDSGISLDHPEFAGRIDRRNSIDIVTGSRSTLEDQSGHGSHIAGIIAANVDGAGMRGVAPQATLLAIRADLRDRSICDTAGCGYFDRDVAAALDHARAQRADIVNLSIGKSDALSPAYRAALERIIASGALVVVAAGNQGDSQPLSPGRLANASAMRGGMLVAGAVDRNNAAYWLNNKAGNVADYFLVAPGVDIYSTFKDGGYQRLTGTSMAAPHIAGAAAVVKSAFPSLSMQQVGEILLTTADDLGPRGVDQTFGRGLVNLERALRPIGRQQVAIDDDIDGRRVSLSGSRLTLGPSFGDALSNASGLSRAMVLDAYDRPFVSDLSRVVRRSDRGSMILDRKLRDDVHYRDVQLDALAPLGIDARLAFSENADRPLAGSARAALTGGQDEDEQLFQRLSFGAIELPAGQATLGIGLTAAEVGATPGSARAGGLFLDADSLLAPADTIVARGTGGSMRFALTEHTALSFGVLDSSDLAPRAGKADIQPSRLLSVGAEHRLGAATALQLSYAYVDEREGVLGSDASGAFAFAEGATSHLGTARLGYRLTGGVELFAQATVGMTRLDGESGVLREWSEVRSDAFALGVIADGVAADGDRLGLMVGQPLRVASASAMLDLPVARDLDGRIERSRERVDMAPSGRELRLELAYTRPLADRQTLGTWLLLQHEPGHDTSAEPAMGIGMRYTSRF